MICSVSASGAGAICLMYFMADGVDLIGGLPDFGSFFGLPSLAGSR